MNALLTFRRSKFTGKWCAFGPAELLKVGSVVSVHRADGSALKKVTSVSKPFMREGTMFAYGHVVENDICPQCQSGEISRDADANLCPVCALEDGIQQTVAVAQ